MPGLLVPSPTESYTDHEENLYSIFHSDWWLDAVTEGQWKHAEVRQGGEVVGYWPYVVKNKWGLKVCVQPALTRSLGPWVSAGKGSAINQFRREAEIVRELIGQLPGVQYISQTLDPRSGLGIHFKNSGFTCALDYTFRTVAGRSSDLLWQDMRDKTRNLIRSATNAGVTAALLPDPEAFFAFYAARLSERHVKNVCPPPIMRRLCLAAIERGAGKVFGAYDTSGTLIAAIFAVWDAGTEYYLLSCRLADAHSGAISLLIWNGMQEAAAAGRAFDLDGTPTPSIVRFLTGFSANVLPRVQIVRGGATMRLAHTLSRRLASRSMFGSGEYNDVFIPD